MLNFREEFDVIKLKRKTKFLEENKESTNKWLKDLLKEIKEKGTDFEIFSEMKLKIYLDGNNALKAEIVRSQADLPLDSTLKLSKDSYNLILVNELRKIFKETWGYKVEELNLCSFNVIIENY